MQCQSWPSETYIHVEHSSIGSEASLPCKIQQCSTYEKYRDYTIECSC